MHRSDKSKSARAGIRGERLRIGIAVSEFNADVTEKLLAGAQKDLLRAGVLRRNSTVVRVPGSFELPLACQRMAESGRYDALLALGCVIKGETDHYYYIAGEAAAGIMKVMLKHDIPIGFGVLTTDTVKQAQARSSGRSNKGAEAARAVLELLTSFDAAITSRELGKPCIIGTRIATKVLKDGDLVEVNADEGVVKILKKR